MPDSAHVLVGCVVSGYLRQMAYFEGECEHVRRRQIDVERYLVKRVILGPTAGRLASQAFPVENEVSAAWLALTMPNTTCDVVHRCRGGYFAL